MRTIDKDDRWEKLLDVSPFQKIPKRVEVRQLHKLNKVLSVTFMQALMTNATSLVREVKVKVKMPIFQMLQVKKGLWMWEGLPVYP